MTTCGRCGHTVEVGRFCTNCGAPVDAGRTDTAERPAAGGPGRSAVPTSPPPPLPPPPSSARYPLFADEVGADGPVAPPPPPPPPPPAPAPAPSSHRSSGRRGTGWLVGLAVLALLVVVGLGGAVLLLSSGDDEDRADDTRSTPSSSPTRASGSPAPATSAPATDPPAAGIGDVARSATVEVPATAKPGTDVDGSRIRYDADQMLDGDPTTCWRMVGDGTGEEIVLTLAQPTTLSEVGIVNGYAKSARDGRGRTIDWYAGNRRIREVEWVFDDGTSVTQELGRTRDLQSLPIEPVETSTVTLRLVDVSRPGKDRRSARDNTAISEIALLGTPAS